MTDIQTIEKAILKDNMDKLNIQEIKKEINELNDKVDDIMLVLENITNSTPTYKEAASLWQIV